MQIEVEQDQFVISGREYRHLLGFKNRATILSTKGSQTKQPWKCKAQPTADPPSDCDWPFCGCDPYADKVLAAIDEAGFILVREGAGSDGDPR